MSSRPAPPRHVVPVVGTTLVVLSALMLGATRQDIQNGTQQVERVMLAQAQSVVDLVVESSRHSYRTYARWEDEVAARLLDNARWIARRDSLSPLRDADLARYAELHGLGRINLFDARGEKTATSRVEPEEDLPPRHDPRDFIAPILRGEARELRIGFKPARFRGGSRFAVAVARRGGGAVVVNVFADSMQAVLHDIQPSHLLTDLGSANGVRFVAVQRRDSVLAQFPAGFDSLFPHTPEPRRPEGVAPLVREYRAPGGHVYEVARAAELPRAGAVVIRVGLDAGPLDLARAAIRDRAWMRAIVVLAVGLLSFVLLLLWQRHGLLAREMAVARAELGAREAEVQRTARLAAMGELASHVAHEIRNPLNTIHMTAQEMTRSASLPGALQQRAEDIRTESRRIESIVQQFLEFTRPRTPRPERVDLDRVATDAGRRALAAFRAADLELAVIAEPVAARVDPVLAGEILDNLLRNAREASPPGSRVTLSSLRRDNDAMLVVVDEGPGVPAEMRDRIFDLYFTTKPTGTGLGLSLVQQACAAMGGSVRLEDPPRRGARFVVRFPAIGGPP